MGSLLAFTPVMWSTARCYNDSSCGYGVLWGLFWTPSFFPGLGLWFHPRGFLYISCIPPMYVFMGDFSKKINLKIFLKKLFCAFLCLSLGLKKPGDFTVSEGHGYPRLKNISRGGAWAGGNSTGALCIGFTLI
jgi:hypothetical protein